MNRRVLTPGMLTLAILFACGLALLIFLQPVTAQPTAQPLETTTATPTETTTATPTETATATPTETATPGPGRDRTITVTGTGVITTTANVAKINATVEVTSTSATEALSQTNRIIQDVQAAVTGLGVSPEDVEIGSISVFPNIGPGGPPPNGYRAIGSLTITVRDTSQAGAVLEAATRAGANATSLFFILEPSAAMLDQARQRAFQDAQERAARLAQLAGGTLGQVISIVEHNASPPPAPPSARVGVSLTVTFELR